MGFSTEVKAVLGIDSSKMPEDARKVIEKFKEAARALENEASKHGEGAGEKFAHGLGHKLTNAKHLSGALATALGLNVEKIAEHIASAITGGSAEGWRKSVEIAEKNAEIIEKIIEAHMDPAQVLAKHKKDLDRALRDQKESSMTDTTAGRIAVTSAIGIPGLDRFLAAIGIGQTQAELMEEQAKKGLKVNEADLQVLEDQKKEKEQLLQLDDQALALREQHGTLTEKEKALRDHIKALMLSLVNDDLTAVEIKKKQNELTEKELALQDNLKEQKKKQLEIEKADLAIQEKKAELVHQRRTLEKDEAKLTDRGKLTVGELSALRNNPEDERARQQRREQEDRQRAFGTFGENANLSSEAVDAKEKAIQIKRLEEDAEAARLRGDSAGAQDALNKVGVMRDALVKSGFTKSTEGDPARELREQIAKDNEQIIKTLNEIATTEKGKYTNQ